MTVQLLEETPAVLSLEKLCEEHGCSYEWASGQEPHLTKKEIPGLSSSSSRSSASSSSTSFPQDSSSTFSSPARLRCDQEAAGNRLRDLLEWLRSSQIISKPQKCQQSQTLLTIRNVLRKWYPGSTVFTHASQKIEMRSMFANQNDKGSLQRTHWCASSRKVW